MKSNRSRSLKMGPIDRSYSRACVTITSSGVCFVSKQLASTSFRIQAPSTLLVQRWRCSSGNVWLFNLLISSCYILLHRTNSRVVLYHSIRGPGPPLFVYDTIRYDSVYLTCSKKLTGSQLSPPHGHTILTSELV